MSLNTESCDYDRGRLEFMVQRIQRKINEGNIDNDKILKYLRFLSHASIDLEMLKATSIGKTINALRKGDGKIGEKAKNLIIKWKDMASNTHNPQEDNINQTIISNSSKPKLIVCNGTSESNHKNFHIAEDHSSIFPQLKSIKKPLPQNGKIPHKEMKNMIPSTSMNINDDVINTDDDSMYTNSKASFEDMLVMPMKAMQKKKLKKKQKHLLQTSKISMPVLPDLPTSLDIEADIVNTLESDIKTTSTDAKKKRSLGKDAGTLNSINSSHLEDIVSRKTRSQMYTGKKNTSGVVTSLYQQAMRVLIENVESLYDTGGVPFSILKPLLLKCNPYQLQRLEQYNPHFVSDEESDELWKGHCQREFKGQKPSEMEQWRELYQRLCDEREIRLQKLSSKITAHQAAKIPERSVKLAYVASRPNVHAKKNIPLGISKKRIELKEKLEKDHPADAVAVPFTKVPRRDRCSFRPPSSLSHGGSFDMRESHKVKETYGTKGPSKLMPSAPKKPAKKPMMAAALKLMKKQHGRAASQIIRR